MDLKRVLLASDLSQRSEVALRRAVRLAGEHGSELVLLHVVDDEIPASIANEIRSAATETLAALLVGLGADAKPAHKIEVRFGRVWKSIVDASEELGADLIVAGSHRSRGLVDLFRGTTLERVAKSVRVPVLMTTGTSHHDYKNVVVGVDFSPCSLKAVDTANKLAPDADISLLSSYHIPFRDFIDREVPGDSDIRAEKKRIEHELRERLSVFKKDCPSRPKGYAQSFIEGSAANALMGYASNRGTDLICVGSHGRGWLAEAFLGSTARELLSGAPCDVLVTPQD